MKASKIVVLGGTGFVGRQLVQRLARDGHSITVLSRNRDQHRELLVLPRVRINNANVHDRADLARELAGADVAVNLIGILNESGRDGSGFRKAHVGVTENLIAACADARVSRVLQMSALRAGEGESHYLRTRGEADARLMAAPLGSTIFRPSVIFGAGDGLFCRFARLLRLAPVLPLARGDATFAPVFVGDVAEAFARALLHNHTIGRIYDLPGPQTITLAALVRWTAELIGKRRVIVPLPDALGFVQAAFGEWLPGKPISRDNFRSLKLDSTSTNDGLAALGIIGAPMDVIVPGLLRGNGRQGRYDRFRALY